MSYLHMQLRPNNAGGLKAAGNGKGVVPKPLTPHVNQLVRCCLRILRPYACKRKLSLTLDMRLSPHHPCSAVLRFDLFVSVAADIVACPIRLLQWHLDLNVEVNVHHLRL